jgi:hypothetical protein
MELGGTYYASNPTRRRLGLFIKNPAEAKGQKCGAGTAVARRVKWRDVE